MKFLFGTALLAFSSLLTSESAMAHQAVGDDDDGDAYLLNRQAKIELEPVKQIEKTSAKHPVVHSFSGHQRKTRGHLIVFRNKINNQIVDLELVEDEIASDMTTEFTEEVFAKKCEQNQLYQLEVPELSLMTSMQACYYAKQSGLNDTVSFATNREGDRLVGMHVETRDIKHLASLERNPRKKRLMQERQFGKFVGKALLSKMI